MAKYYNNRIKTGKLAGSVFAVRNGEVIERAYNPVVTNPNTEAQIEARAKLKLMSQLSAVFGKTIAIRREGGAAPRNLFVRANYNSATYTNGTASINMLDIKLTNGVLALPAVVVSRGTDGITAHIDGNVSAMNYIVYVVMFRTDDNKLRLFTSKVVNTPGDNGSFQTIITTSQLSITTMYVYAYGVRLNSELARVKFGSIVLETAESVVVLATQSSLTESDITMTETRAAELLPAD